MKSEFNKYGNSPVNSGISNAPKISFFFSWPIIILTCVIFWPVGLFLLWRRVVIDKKASLTIGRGVTICGYVGLAIALLGLFVSISEGITGEDVAMILFFSIAGVALVALGRNITKSAQRFRKYISIIVNQSMTSIDNIAAAIPVSYDLAKKDIQKMIDRGYFTGAYIDEGTRELVLPRNSSTVSIEENTHKSAVAEPVETRLVSCKSCGANNTIIVGRTSECEFCGSPIS